MRNSKIQKRRKGANLKIYEVVEFLGISESTVRKMESGYAKPTSLEVIAKMAKLYQCSLEDIFNDFNVFLD